MEYKCESCRKVIEIALAPGTPIQCNLCGGRILSKLRSKIPYVVTVACSTPFEPTTNTVTQDALLQDLDLDNS